MPWLKGYFCLAEKWRGKASPVTGGKAVVDRTHGKFKLIIKYLGTQQSILEFHVLRNSEYGIKVSLPLLIFAFPGLCAGSSVGALYRTLGARSVGPSGKGILTISEHRETIY